MRIICLIPMITMLKVDLPQSWRKPDNCRISQGLYPNSLLRIFNNFRIIKTLPRYHLPQEEFLLNFICLSGTIYVLLKPYMNAEHDEQKEYKDKHSPYQKSAQCGSESDPSQLFFVQFGHRRILTAFCIEGFARTIPWHSFNIHIGNNQVVFIVTRQLCIPFK